MFLAPHVANLWLTVLIVGIAGSATQGWSANIYSFPSDTMPRASVSSIVGLNGFVSFLAGGLTSRLVGHLLDTTGSYVWIFAAASLMYVASLAIIHVLVPRISEPAP